MYDSRLAFGDKFGPGKEICRTRLVKSDVFPLEMFLVFTRKRSFGQLGSLVGERTEIKALLDVKWNSSSLMEEGKLGLLMSLSCRENCHQCVLAMPLKASDRCAGYLTAASTHQ